jgi:Fe-S cluster biogenesis protein NfuA
MATVADPAAAAAAGGLSLTPERRDFHAHTERVERLVSRLNSSSDPELRATALELLQCVLELHGAVLGRMIDSIAQTDAGEAALDQALKDDLVASVLLLHGLHPEPVETRVQRALESVRPYLRSHHGDVEFVSLHDGVVRLRLVGSCGSCPSSSITLKNAVEEALYATGPDITEIIAEDRTAAPSHPVLVVLQ